jgi:hypothetical protein
MRRRELMLVVGGAMTAAHALHAQQPERVRRVGILNPSPENDLGAQARVTAFVQAEGGRSPKPWVEFAPDSPLEGDGFELPVPRQRRHPSPTAG